MSKSQYEQIHDGEWFDLLSKWDFACCDCGLVHTVRLRLKDGKLQMRMDLHPKATGGIRAAAARAKP